MRQSLDASLTQVQWINNAYMLALSALILVGGAAGDKYGLRRIFSAGIAFFVAASIACAFATGPDMLIAARAAQGIGAAIMGSQFHLEDLDEYYRHCVIGGPRSFVIPVLEWDAFPEAVRRKLVLELAEAPLPVQRAAIEIQSQSSYNCLIGELIWQRFRNDFFNP